jgi:signal transduction histidine kinase
VKLAKRILGVPLAAKLAGANVIIVASAVLLQALAFASRRAELITVVAGLTAALVVNVVLVYIALRPVEELEELALRVSEGEFDARAASSPFADRDLERLRQTVNELLDALAAERGRIQELGVQVVEQQDVERASVSRELHDSIAQTLAAVRFQISAAGRDADSEVSNRLAAANGMVASAMEEIMKVSYSLHSRVADDLGIEAALDTLARQVKQRSGLDVSVHVAHPDVSMISGATSSTLYRVAEEALRTTENRADVASASISLFDSRGAVNIEIIDDGSMDEVVLTPGLIAVKHRVLLAGGKMIIDTAPTGGMRVKAELRTMRAAS